MMLYPLEIGMKTFSKTSELHCRQKAQQASCFWVWSASLSGNILAKLELKFLYEELFQSKNIELAGDELAFKFCMA